MFHTDVGKLFENKPNTCTYTNVVSSQSLLLYLSLHTYMQPPPLLMEQQRLLDIISLPGEIRLENSVYMFDTIH